MLETRTITHGDPEKPSLEVVVSEASALMGMRHSILISEAVTVLKASRKKEEPAKAGRPAVEEPPPEPVEEPPPEPVEEPRPGPALVSILDEATEETAVFLMRRFTWPNCIACTISAKGFDHRALTFGEFCLMPEQFVSKWEKAALELNPHWRPGEEEEEAEAGKKEESASEKS